MEINKKSTLAKLLATENITLEHRKVPTAYFDLKERKVVLPMWKEMDSDLYDMLIGHEVSHALNTPYSGWHDNVIEYGPGIKSFLNVVEDARIERLIKEKFPGLVKNFYAGYRKLFNDDFFGVKGRDLSELPLIDRINLHFKIGSMLGIDFTDEEQVMVDRVANCQTWEDVVEVAHDLYGDAKAELEEQQEQESGESSFEFEDEEFENDYEPSSGDSESEEEEKETEEEGNSPSNESKDKEEEASEEESNEPRTPEVEQGSDNTEPVAQTDVNYREAEESLLNTNSKDIIYADWNTLDPKKFVVPVKKTWAFDFEGVFKEDWGSDVKLSPKQVGETLTNRFKTKNTSYINQMVQQFEMKRTAHCLARSRQNKTGELNMKKLWATQLTEDVFLSNTVVPQGKNHGMMMFIDFSGSMSGDIAATLEQTLIMTAFCKKVNIPFDVYGFTNALNYNSTVSAKTPDQLAIDNGGITPGKMHIADERFALVQLINSKMSSTAYKDAFAKMLMTAEVYECRKHYYSNVERDWTASTWDLPDYLQLSGTPLNEAAMVARELIKKFKADNRIEIMNAIFLTDGGPTGNIELGVPTSYYKADRIIIREGGINTVEKFGYYDRYSQSIQLRAILKHIKATVDVNLINFHIGSFKKSDLSSCYMQTSAPYEAFDDKYKKEFLGNKFFELNAYQNFDTVYLIKNGKSLEIEEQTLEVKSDKKGDLLRGFRNFQKGKASSRVFLSRLMDKVA